MVLGLAWVLTSLGTGPSLVLVWHDWVSGLAEWLSGLAVCLAWLGVGLSVGKPVVLDGTQVGRDCTFSTDEHLTGILSGWDIRSPVFDYLSFNLI